MHVFQPVDVKEVDFNAFRMIGEEYFALTTELDGKANAMTASWGGMGVMWGKNVVFVVVRDSRYTKEIMDATDTFSLSFLNRDKYNTVMRYLGAASGRNEDKIAAMGLNINHYEGIPYIDEARTVVCVKKLFRSPMEPESFLDPEIISKWYAKGDYHTLYIGEIKQVMLR